MMKYIFFPFMIFWFPTLQFGASIFTDFSQVFHRKPAVDDGGHKIIVFRFTTFCLQKYPSCKLELLYWFISVWGGKRGCEFGFWIMKPNNKGVKSANKGEICKKIKNYTFSSCKLLFSYWEKRFWMMKISEFDWDALQDLSHKLIYEVQKEVWWWFVTHGC